MFCATCLPHVPSSAVVRDTEAAPPNRFPQRVLPATASCEDTLHPQPRLQMLPLNLTQWPIFCQPGAPGRTLQGDPREGSTRPGVWHVSSHPLHWGPQPASKSSNCLKAMKIPSSLGKSLTLTMDFVFFFILGFTRSIVGRGGNFFSSSRTAIAAFFFEIFLLFPSPSPTNSPTDTLVTKFFMWGGPLSRATCFRGKDWVKVWQTLTTSCRAHWLAHYLPWSTGKGQLRTSPTKWKEHKCQQKETVIILHAFLPFSIIFQTC